MKCTRPRRALRGLLLLPFLLLLDGCGTEPTSPGPATRVVIATQVPAGRYGVLPEPGARYPIGSRLVCFDLARPDEPPVVITEGMAAAGGAVPTLDGTEILFVGKATREEPYAVWSCRLDGSDRRKVVEATFDCGGVAELPDGRIVYSRSVSGEPVSDDMRSAWALFVKSPDAREGHRISFGAGCDIDPHVLIDGRILYTAWKPALKGAERARGLFLFTVFPDGTGAAELPCEHGGMPFAVLPRQAWDGTIVYVRRGPGSGGFVSAADWRSTAALPGLATVPLPAGDGVAIEPTSDGRMLAALLPVAGGAGEEAEGGLYVVTPLPVGRESPGFLRSAGERVDGPYLLDNAWEVVHAVEGAPRRRPQGHLSTVKPALAYGDLLCLDARPPDRPGAAQVRLRVSDKTSGNDRVDRGRILGEVSLAADGSFFVRVPADTPLLLDVLDAQGTILGRGETPFWVRPNETRACVGCHEDPETAPPNRRPLALDVGPVPLLPTAEDDVR